MRILRGGWGRGSARRLRLLVEGLELLRLRCCCRRACWFGSGRDWISRRRCGQRPIEDWRGVRGRQRPTSPGVRRRHAEWLIRCCTKIRCRCRSSCRYRRRDKTRGGGLWLAQVRQIMSRCRREAFAAHEPSPCCASLYMDITASHLGYDFICPV